MQAGVDQEEDQKDEDDDAGYEEDDLDDRGMRGGVGEMRAGYGADLRLGLVEGGAVEGLPSIEEVSGHCCEVMLLKLMCCYLLC